jgi:myo-inositol-1(or 4)-monophosphatase
LRVSKTSRVDASLLVTGFPYDVRTNPDNNLDYFAGFMLRSQAVRRIGSAALDFCYLAAGRFDGFWEFKLHAWDVAAATLMITEAGGAVTDLQGRPHDIYSEEILASNGLIHEEMLQAIREMSKNDA